MSVSAKESSILGLGKAGLAEPASAALQLSRMVSTAPMDQTDEECTG